MKDVVIVGAGGLGREALTILEAANQDKKQFNILGFIESDRNRIGEGVAEVPILGDDSWLAKHSSVEAVCGVGFPRPRKNVVLRLLAAGTCFLTIIHPDVRIPRNVSLGNGSIVMAGTVFSANAIIGSQTILYLNCSIPHDVVIGDFCLIASGVALGGGVEIGEGVELGTNSSVIPFKKVGSWSVVGAASVVIQDLPEHVTAVGVPCRITSTQTID